MRKLDFNVFAYLCTTNAKISKPIDFDSTNEITRSSGNVVYIFDSYDEYVGYLKKYINEIDEELIKCAICMTGFNGQIAVLKPLCDRIIITQRTREFYDSYTEDKIDEIHSRNKMTPFEKAMEYEISDFCVPGDEEKVALNRCKFFSDCHSCLLEYASHKKEYDATGFKLEEDDDLMYEEDSDVKLLKKQQKNI